MWLLFGLPLECSACESRTLLLYLLWITSFDVLIGSYTASDRYRLRYFSLPRAGYKRWWQMLLKRVAILTVLYVLVGVALTTFLSKGQAGIATAAVHFLINCLMFAFICTWLQALTQNTLIPFLVLTLNQLISIFGSIYLPYAHLLGWNWGMLTRSDWLTDSGASPVFIFTVELAIILSLASFGWILVRKADQAYVLRVMIHD